MAEELAPEGGDHAVGRAVSREITGAVQRGAGHDGQPDHDDGGHDVAQRGVVQEGAVHHVRQGDRLYDDEDGAEHADGQRDARDPPQAGDPGGQPRVDQAGRARARGSFAHRKNVVSFTSIVRPTRPSARAKRAVGASSQAAAVRVPLGRSATMAVRTGSSPPSPP